MKKSKKIFSFGLCAIAIAAAPSIYSLTESELSTDTPKYFVYVTLDDNSFQEAEFISAVIPTSIFCYFRSVADQTLQNKFLSDGAGYRTTFDQYKCEDDSGILSALPKNPAIPPEVIAKATRVSADDPIVYKIWMKVAATDNNDKDNPYYASEYESGDYSVMKLFPNGAGQFGKMQVKGSNNFSMNLLGNEASVVFDDTSNNVNVTETIFLRSIVEDGLLNDGSSRYYAGRLKSVVKQSGAIRKDVAFVTDKETNTIVRSDIALGNPARCYKLGKNLQTVFDRSQPNGFLLYQASTGSRIKNMISYGGYDIKTNGTVISTVPIGGGLIFNSSLQEGITYQLTNGQTTEDIKVKAYRRNINLQQVAAAENDSLCNPLFAKLTANVSTLVAVEPPAADWSSVIEFPSALNIPANPKPL